MQFCDINKIPSDITDGKMTVSEGATLLADIINSNQRAFGLGGLNSEIRQGVLGNLDAPCCQDILKVFDSRGGTLQEQLKHYIHYLVRQQKWMWQSVHRLSNVYDKEEDTPKHVTHGMRRILKQRSRRYAKIRSSHQR